MKRSKVVWALVALNVLLGAALIGQWVRPNMAHAQVARPSDYIMVPGTVQGLPQQVIYIVDTQNGLLSARMFDGRQLQDMPPIDLKRFLQPANNPNPGRRGTR